MVSEILKTRSSTSAHLAHTFPRSWGFRSAGIAHHPTNLPATRV